jgi:hypothetical protein
MQSESCSEFEVHTGIYQCTPLLQGGQQLEVLSKLLETHQFAPHVANFPLWWVATSIYIFLYIGSEFLNDESSLLTPVLFSKLKLQHVVQQ